MPGVGDIFMSLTPVLVDMETIFVIMFPWKHFEDLYYTMSNIQLAPVIIGKLLNLGGILQRNGNRLLLPFELNQQQFSIFFEIAQAERINQKNLINRLLLEKAHVSKVVKKLHQMGLIDITESSDDKRSAWLSPTCKGKRVIEKIMKVLNQWNEEWIAELSNKKAKEITDHLDLLQTIFKEKVK